MSNIKIILVPLANPNTVEGLLRLAWTFVEDDDCKIIALHVLLGNLDDESKMLDELEPIIEELKEEGAPIEFITQKATNIARGILDAAGESGADMIVLGIKKRGHGQVELGTVAENILSTASAKVVIYRPTNSSEPPARIVVPVDGSTEANAAVRLGAALARRHEVDMVAIHAQESYFPRWVGLGHIEESLEGVNDDITIKRQLVTASDPASSILARLEDDDLLVMGYTRRSALEQWLFGNFSRQMLEKAPCPALLTTPSEENGLLETRIRRRLTRFQFRLTPDEQEDMQRQAYDLSAADLDYMVLIAVAAMLASLGLLSENVAVIIGAMLVAPFMQPCIAFAIGITTRRFKIMRRAFFTLMAGVPLAIIIAVLCNILVRNVLPTTEMLARGNTTMLDVLVAFASGVVGAYATVRKDISSVLAGVAIAAALMPPLCTVGLGFAINRPALALGAAGLFTTNIVFIVLAAWLVFILVGLRPTLAANT